MARIGQKTRKLRDNITPDAHLVSDVTLYLNHDSLLEDHGRVRIEDYKLDYSLGGKLIPDGGTAMFALFALAGDLGCTAGPSVVAFLSGNRAEGLSTGLLGASAFPAILALGALLLRFGGRKKQ